MSRRDEIKQGPLGKVQEALLLHLAERLGPVIDCVDVVGEREVGIRSVILALVAEQVGSPAEIRAAIEDLVEWGFLGADPSLHESSSRVGITPRGLVEARAIKPGIGAPKIIGLRLTRGPSEFAAKFETDSREQDRELNRSGLVLACFYAIALVRPEAERPATVESLQPYLRGLAVLGIGPRSGPGDRIEAKAESISKALHSLGPLLSLRARHDPEDERRREWVLEDGFPEVRVRAPRAKQDLCDWTHLCRLLKQRLADLRRDGPSAGGETGIKDSAEA